MKSIIKQLLRESLLEAIAYQDDDIIDFNEINLMDEFHKLNNLLFDGKINPSMSVVWSLRRTAHGHVSATKNRLTGDITVKKLAVSKFFNIRYKLFKDVLAHELIHVYLFQKGIWEKENRGHGYNFHKEMMRINSMGLGFNVTVKGDSSELEISSSIKGKDLVFVILELDGKRVISVMNHSTYDVQARGIANIFKQVVGKGKYRSVSGVFWESNNVLLRKFPVQRSFQRSISYNPITDDVYKQLISDSNKVSEFMTDGKEVIWSGREPK